MIEIAQTYLGNLQEDKDLAARIRSASKECLKVYLSQQDVSKGRIQVQSTSGVALGIIKSRDWVLRSGDVFATESGNLLLIHLQKQKLMVLSFDEPLTAKATELVYLGHVLGNHHYPITIAQNKIYLQLTEDCEVIEQTIRALQIKDLKINYESSSPDQSLDFSHHHHH